MVSGGVQSKGCHEPLALLFPAADPSYYGNYLSHQIDELNYIITNAVQGEAAKTFSIALFIWDSAHFFSISLCR